MGLLRRYRMILTFGIVVGLMVLGRAWMLSSDKTNDPANRAVAATSAQPAARVSLPVEKTAAVPPTTARKTSGSGAFHGRVIDAATRESVREFELQLHDGRGRTPNQARTFRAPDGRFEWPDAPAGAWIVTATARGYQRFEITGLTISKSETTADIVMPLRRGYILTGRVYDQVSRAGIAAASIGVREAQVGAFEGNFRMRARATSDQSGAFVLDGVPGGAVTLSVGAANYASLEFDIVVREKNSPLEIGLSSGGTIAGYLAAADGTPVVGEAGLFDADRGFGSSSRTGDAGEFSFPHLAAGRYRLTGRSAAGAAEREIVLAENESMVGIVLRPQAGRSIRGVIRGLRSEEIERVTVSAYRGNVSGATVAEARSDARGAYVLPSVPAGPVRVTAEVTLRRQLWRSVDMPADADITVDFDFPRGARLSGHVTRGGKPVASTQVQPRPVVRDEDIFVYPRQTSPQGDYVFEDLPAGEYNLIVGRYRSRTVRVSGDTVFDIEVPPAELSGRVIEDAGKVPIVGADVVLWSAPKNPARIRLQSKADDFGQFALAGIEPGEYILTAYKPGFEMFRDRISYGSPIADMTIRLRAASGAEISVREAGSGRPLRSVSVVEMMGDRNGNILQLHLDENGVGYLPSALAGSTLTFSSYEHGPTTIRNWTGQGLELRLERRAQ